jgi:L-asparaginase II
VATFATPVTLAATAYARLSLLVPRAAAAMRAHPVLVEGEGLIDTALMQAFPGLVSKDGAEGLGCALLPDGRGVAVKALDGADRAMAPALIPLVLRCLGLADVPDVLAPLARPPRHNGHGDVVGELVGRLPD